MKIPIAKLKKGDCVFVDGDSGFCDTGFETITDVTQRREYTGVQYNVIWFGDHQFDSRTGRAINSPTAYFLHLESEIKEKL